MIMQIIRTDVGQTTVPSGHRVLRVMFCGEGGDCVTVDIAAVEHTGEAAAIERGKALPIETATFDSAEIEYDARSNGNFDEVIATSARDGIVAASMSSNTATGTQDALIQLYRSRFSEQVEAVPMEEVLSRWRAS